MPDKQTVAVLGAGGMMGFAMARNLLRAGFDVRAWNRSRDKAQPLAEDGAHVCDSPARATDGADVLLTMLADADAVLECARQALWNGAPAGLAWLQMSTIGEQGTERCIELAGEHDVQLLDAPVLGTKQPAQEGKLVILASGEAALCERAAPIFDAIGQRTMHVGELGAATRLKVAVNSWILTVVEGAAETFALAEGMGIDPQLLLEAVKGGSLDLPYLQMKGHAMLKRDFEPSFRLALAAKDAALMEQSTRRHGLDLPLLTTIAKRLAQAVPEHGDKDIGATYLTSTPVGARAAS